MVCKDGSVTPSFTNNKKKGKGAREAQFDLNRDNLNRSSSATTERCMFENNNIIKLDKY